MNRKMIWALGSAGTLLAVGPIAYAASLQQLQQQEAQAQAQLAAERAAYNQTQNAINATMAAIGSLTANLNAAQHQIGTTSQQISATTAEINQTQALLSSTQSQLTATQNELNATEASYQTTTKLLAETQQQLQQQTGLLSGQLQLIEERGSVGYLDVVLGAHSFSDFVSRVSMLGQVAASAAQEVQMIKREEAQQAQEKANLAEEAQMLSASRASLAQHQALLQQEENLLAQERARSVALHYQAISEAQSFSNGLAERQQAMNQLQSQRAQLLATMSALASEIAQITGQIEALLGQYNHGGMSLRSLYDAMLPLVTPIAARYGLPPALVIAVITQESGGNAAAQSSAGAIGLMQIEPATAAYIAQYLGQSPSTVVAELTNPEENLLIGCFYLHDMLTTFGGNVSLALAAYNAGPGAVEQYGGIPPYPETQNYVRDVEYYYNLYSQW